MKTSARNELTGKISDIQVGVVMSEVKLDVNSGIHISATITKESVDSLGLTKGMEVTALIKSSSVILSKEPLKVSARNTIKGTIKELIKGAVNSEVKLSIGDNGTIYAIVTNDAVEDLGFSVGETAYAIIKASNVILVA
ncbi:TOBE domain-containing protein [Halarcobacter ebronensis]|uniref:Molybdenum-pterin-binding protein n=1 Tax=Halarcobacter ebronensis TaxID=1462615 RepID=A0A4Q1AR01_9BACT|nr:TOBE domain-containing protein [Halarcobacter ebronensis]QKF82429.1 molybdenum-pterin binding domain-containing protein [Halarcobacter ebronensis]RXK07549.1 molybdenum-pterin-binding protein [Halarcobacter ebronensis]